MSKKKRDNDSYYEKNIARELSSTLVTKSKVKAHLGKMVNCGLLRENYSLKDMKEIIQYIPSAVYYECLKEAPGIVNRIENFGEHCKWYSIEYARLIIQKDEQIKKSLTNERKMYQFKFDEYSDRIDYDMYEIVYADDPVQIFADERFDRNWTPTGRKPYYQMRGKRITSQQAFDIICKSDSLFSINLNLEGSIVPADFDMEWFNPGSSSGPFGWVHPNGIIGLDFHTGKDPTVYEFAEQWAKYLYHFPYLDLIVGVTFWNEENPVQYFRNIYEMPDFPESRTDEDFYYSLEAGIWVHDRKIEILGEEDTVRIYRQYEELHGEKDKRVYSPGYYKKFQPDIVTMNYLKKCLLTYGITDSDKFLYEKLSPYDLKRLPK